jgi:hypothetical protein
LAQSAATQSPIPAGHLLLDVALSACSLIAFEIIAFQALVYVNDYLAAMRIVALSLMGLGVGGLVAWRWPGAARSAWWMVLLPLAVLASGLVVAFGTSVPPLWAVLALPFVVGGARIGHAFNTLPAQRVYVVDLAGAALGGALALALIPWAREEGGLLVVACVSALPALRALFASHPLVALLLALVCGTPTLAQLTADPFNLANLARVDRGAYPDKVFHRTRTRTGESEPRSKVLWSRGSLVARIDAGYHTADARRSPQDHNHILWSNGRPADHISRRRSQRGMLDRRLPTRLKGRTNPDTLLVGPAGEGLTKVVQALGHGRIDAVELNGAVARLMTGPLAPLSGRSYAHLNLTIGDVRTYLRQTARRYDFIALPNAHRVRTVGDVGPPEYTHTLEAATDYLEHLADDGWLLFEERNINDRADLAIRRMLHTTVEALSGLGVSEPSSHVAVYEFFICPQETWFSDRDQCRRSNRHTLMLFKRSPMTKDELDHLEEWGRRLGQRGRGTAGTYLGIEWMYLPGRIGQEPWRSVASGDPSEMPADALDLAVITDDRPFPGAVFRSRSPILGLVAWVLCMAALVVALPTGLALRGRWRVGPPARTALLVGAAAALGLSYLGVEMVLFQWFVRVLASPTMALGIVLPAMLLGSGVGATATAGAARRTVLLVVAFSSAAAALGAMPLAWAVDAMTVLPWPHRVAGTAALSAGVGGVLGVALPHLLQLADRERGLAGLLFGVNGTVAATAAPLTLLLAMEVGYGATLALCAAPLALAGVCLAGVHHLDRRRTVHVEESR